MPSGGKATMLKCENCKNIFKKKFQGKITNRWCCRNCRDEFLIKEKISLGNYTKSAAITFFKRFTEYKCVECGVRDNYNNKPLKLQIDHIDGNNKNNLITNLRYLCPNCHTQTETWGVQNVSEEGRKRLQEAGKLGNAIKAGKLPSGSKLIKVS